MMAARLTPDKIIVDAKSDVVEDERARVKRNNELRRLRMI